MWGAVLQEYCEFSYNIYIHRIVQICLQRTKLDIVMILHLIIKSAVGKEQDSHDKKREKNRKFPVLNNVNFHCFINVYIGKDQYNSETTGLLLVSCDLFLFFLNLMQKEQYDLMFKTYRYFPTPVSSAAQQNKVKHSLTPTELQPHVQDNALLLG